MERTELYRWEPIEKNESHELGSPFFDVVCETLASGRRVFLPAIPASPRNRLSQFYACSWVCGFPIFQAQHREQMTPELIGNYRLRWFLFQRMQRMKQFVSRHFHATSDLSVRGGDRELRHILPWDDDGLGGDSELPRSVEQLLETGRTSAKAAGLGRPRIGDQIRFGFYNVALRLISDSTPAVDGDLLATGLLFDLQHRTLPDDIDNRETIQNGILSTLEPYVSDSTITQSAFDEWFWGRSNTFVKQVQASCYRTVSPSRKSLRSLELNVVEE